LVTAYKAIRTPLGELLKQKHLKCKLLQEGKPEVLREQLELYEKSSVKHPHDQYARLNFLVDRNFASGRTHVVLRRKLDSAIKIAGLPRDHGVVLEFAVPEEKVEKAPLYYDSRHAEGELLVPGSLSLHFLTAVYCRQNKMRTVQEELSKAGFKRVRVIPVSQIKQRSYVRNR